MLSLGIFVPGGSVVLGRRLLSVPPHEVADERYCVWILVRKVDQAVPSVERTPSDDCQLYDLILLP